MLNFQVASAPYPKSLFICGFIFWVSLWLNGCTKNNEISANNAEPSILQDEQFLENGLSSRVTNNSAFSQTLFPLLTTHCAGCHGTNQGVAPLLAQSNEALSQAVLEDGRWINLNFPARSRLASKLSVQNHNCWTNCASNGASIIEQVTLWSNLRFKPAQTYYDQNCIFCHGPNGEGSEGVLPFSFAWDNNELTTLINTQMPPNNPLECIDGCATSVASLILEKFSQSQITTQLHGPLEGFPSSNFQLTLLCEELLALGRIDVIWDQFCMVEPPILNGLTDLLSVLGLAIENNPTDPPPWPANFALTGHSSSLVARSTSAINPRVIIFTPLDFPQKSTLDRVTIGFNRGKQFVEIGTFDAKTREIFFYLLTFDQDCNKSNSCSNADLLTRAIEENWVDYTIYSQSDLENSILDCLHCHQPDGPGTASFFRMQEINFPWTHFLSLFTQGGASLMDDFFTANALDIQFGGIPMKMIGITDPFGLEQFIAETSPRPMSSPSPSANWGLASQPNQFDSEIIEAEVQTSAAAQPWVNVPTGKSATWDNIYEATVRGEFIPVPYHDVKITDPDKLTLMTKAVNDFLTGQLPADQFPDIRDVFLESELPAMGFKVKPGLDGEGIITQACAQCHNSKLNQTLTKSRFNVDLNAMSDTIGGVLTGIERDNEIAVTINRLRLPPTDTKIMPPTLFKQLEPAEIDLAVQFLCSQTSSPIVECGN